MAMSDLHYGYSDRRNVNSVRACRKCGVVVRVIELFVDECMACSMERLAKEEKTKEILDDPR